MYACTTKPGADFGGVCRLEDRPLVCRDPPHHAAGREVTSMDGSQLRGWWFQHLLAPEASEFLFKECVVLRASLLALQPHHVALESGVVTLFGTLPWKASLPLCRPLITVLALSQLAELPAGFGISDFLKRGLKGLTCLAG
jgi:hypothetical protein